MERALLAVTKNFLISFDKELIWQSIGNLVEMLSVVIAFAALTSWFFPPSIAATTLIAYILQFAIV